jgi:uncharacterized RDD family membrane protein YckC
MADKNHHDTQREITTEKLSTPTIQINPAPIARRVAAGMIDSLILFIAWTILAITFHQNLISVTRNYLLSSSLILITFVYYFLFEGMFGATFGKHLLKLVVVDREGDPCTFTMSFKRNLLRFIDWLPAVYVIGVSAILISSNRQRVGDLMAGSIVTVAKEKDVNPPPAPFLFH